MTNRNSAMDRPMRQVSELAMLFRPMRSSGLRSSTSSAEPRARMMPKNATTTRKRMALDPLMRQGHERLHGDCMTGKRWRLSFWPMLAFAIVLPALIGLGLWQLGRGAEKAALHERFASGQG